MEFRRWIRRHRLGLIVFCIGLALGVWYPTWLGHLEKNYLHYCQGGEVFKEIDYDYYTTDDNLIWMMRSVEYRKAPDYMKKNMLRSWAEEYTDRHIGRFLRIIIFGIVFLTSFICLFFNDSAQVICRDDDA